MPWPARLAGSGSGFELCQTPADAPCCTHGPALLFERYVNGRPTGRRFFSCSVSRDGCECELFQWEGEKVSIKKRDELELQVQAMLPSCTQEDYTKRLHVFAALPKSQRFFCQQCQNLVLLAEQSQHAKHTGHLLHVSDAALARPATLLLASACSKREKAQFLFSDRVTRWLSDLPLHLGFTRLLCLGTPRVHDEVRVKGNDEIHSMLLDIDSRFEKFYPADEFCRYNMFNNHFFRGEAAMSRCRTFLRGGGGKGALLLMDPPFGGLVALCARAIRAMSMLRDAIKELEKGNDAVCFPREIPFLWIFPYFFENRIRQEFPSCTMLDYQVDYDNHMKFKLGITGRKQSPARIFTNISPSLIPLPTEEGYRYCGPCQRYVAAGNVHCQICKACTSKDGRPWKHCDECGRCVKKVWVHCTTCCSCRPPGHPCPPLLPRGCHICGDPDHKRRYCTKHIPMAIDRSEKLAAATLGSDFTSTNEVASPAGFQPKTVAIREQTKETIATTTVRKTRKTLPQSMMNRHTRKDCGTLQISGFRSSASKTPSHSSLAPARKRIHPRCRLLQEGPHTWRGKRRAGTRGPRKGPRKKISFSTASVVSRP
uniref:rRNA N6-adenosine-methyltransferase ZCCHC4 isoform X2 n=1 Tax=Myxine glutinosa TaxID=7769 RepID=UPI00358DDF6F